MTGQVKEDILSRMIELGISVENGGILFDPVNLKKEEFMMSADNNDIQHFAHAFKIEIPSGKPMLAFSFCGVPVVYLIGENQKVELKFEKEIKTSNHLLIDSVTSHSVFQREGNVKIIVVTFKDTNLN